MNEFHIYSVQYTNSELYTVRVNCTTKETKVIMTAGAAVGRALRGMSRPQAARVLAAAVTSRTFQSAPMRMVDVMPPQPKMNISFNATPPVVSQINNAVAEAATSCDLGCSGEYLTFTFSLFPTNFTFTFNLNRNTVEICLLKFE